MRLLARKQFELSPDLMIRACEDFPRVRSFWVMEVRRIGNHGERDEDGVGEEGAGFWGDRVV